MICKNYKNIFFYDIANALKATPTEIGHVALISLNHSSVDPILINSFKLCERIVDVGMHTDITKKEINKLIKGHKRVNCLRFIFLFF